MATYTTNLNLKKPGAADSVNIDDINGNMDILDGILRLVYPIGAIYTSVSSTSPATLFGGTWSAFGAGRVLVGINPSDTAFDTVEETGGAKTHTLTTAEMPSHRHAVQLPDIVYGGSPSNPGSKINGGPSSSPPVFYTNGGTGVTGHEAMNTYNTGSGDAHNNLQPYIVVYMWKRTA